MSVDINDILAQVDRALESALRLLEGRTDDQCEWDFEYAMVCTAALIVQANLARPDVRDVSVTRDPESGLPIVHVIAEWPSYVPRSVDVPAPSSVAITSRFTHGEEEVGQEEGGRGGNKERAC